MDRTHHIRHHHPEISSSAWRFLPLSMPRSNVAYYCGDASAVPGPSSSLMDDATDTMLMDDAFEEHERRRYPATARIFRPRRPSSIPFMTQRFTGQLRTRRIPPRPPKAPPEEHRPLAIVGDEGQPVPPPTPGAAGSRRGSASSSRPTSPGGLRVARIDAVVSPTRRVGTVVFVEQHRSGFILELKTNAIIAFDISKRSDGEGPLSGKQRRSTTVFSSMPVPQLNMFVSYQHRYNSDRTLEAVNISPTSVVSANGQAATSAELPTPAANDDSYSGPLFSLSDPGPSVSPPNDAAPVSGGEMEVPREGWELFLLLEKIKGRPSLLKTTPADLVRLVEASCEMSPSETCVPGMGKKKPSERKRDSLERDVPRDGPLVALRARQWSARQTVERVLALGRDTLCAEDAPSALGTRSVFEDPPLRLRSEDIEAFNNPPHKKPQRRGLNISRHNQRQELDRLSKKNPMNDENATVSLLVEGGSLRQPQHYVNDEPADMRAKGHQQHITPPRISSKHTEPLPRRSFLGRSWALNQGEVLSNRRSLVDSAVDAENRAFFEQFCRSKAKLATA